MQTRARPPSVVCACLCARVCVLKKCEMRSTPAMAKKKTNNKKPSSANVENDQRLESRKVTITRGVLEENTHIAS